MNINRTELRPAVFAAALLFLAFLVSSQVQGQDSSSAPTKFDEFEDLKTDDIQARLDLFAKKLRNDEHLVGLVVGYRLESFLPGEFLRELHGFREYMVNSLGVDPRQVIVSDAGVSDRIKTELWLTTAPPSNLVSPETVSRDNLTHFDQLTMGPGCVSEYSLVLEEPQDAVRFFAEALQRNPTTKGYVLAHPSKEMNSRQVAKVVVAARDSLRHEQSIIADRISTSIELRRACAAINLWLAPANLSPPTGAQLELFFYSQLMAEAERNGYTVRRITLLGNTYTRDNVIRRRLLQNEGDIFQRKLLEQSLRNVSKLRNFSSVGIQDVEVSLNREYKLIDFLINLTERNPRAGRRTR